MVVTSSVGVRHEAYSEGQLILLRGRILGQFQVPPRHQPRGQKPFYLQH